MRPSILLRILSLISLFTFFLSVADAQWFQDGSKFRGTGAVGTAGQGNAVAISADSSTILVGASSDSGGCGAVWVFVKSGSTWIQQGGKLFPFDALGIPYFGTSVAISADGNSAIIGGSGDNAGVGAAWIFNRTGTVWTQAGSKLVGTGVIGGLAAMGYSVGISADGNTAVVGGMRDSNYAGATWVFTRSGGSWLQEGGKLVGSGFVGLPRQGTSISLSSDGNTLLVGGTYDNGAIGAAWVFTRSGGVWSQQGSKLVGSGYVGSPIYQGSAVALSGDGNTALIGGVNDSSVSRIGAAWVFTRSGGVWSQQGNKLVGSGYYGTDVYQGTSVSLSADGNTAMVGGSGDSTAGAVWVFTRSGGLWSQQGGKIIGSGTIGNSSFGRSVSLSADGNIAAIGGSGDGSYNSYVGALWVYSRGGETWRYRVKRSGTGAAGEARQGQSVALSRNGRYAIAGGPNDNGGYESIWSFERSGGIWVQRGSKRSYGQAYLTITEYYQWTALSADGPTRIVGYPWSDTGKGAIYIDSTRSGFGDWVQNTPPKPNRGTLNANRMGVSVAIAGDGLTAMWGSNGTVWYGHKTNGDWDLNAEVMGAGVPEASFGRSLALSGNGNTAIAGGPEYGSGMAGSAWIFDRSGTLFPGSGTRVVGTGEVGTDAKQGYGVAISDDGNTAVVGGPGDDGNRGAVWVFVRSGSAWAQLGNKLVGAGAAGDAQQGSSVAISADGGTIVVGGPRDNSSRGALWVFIRYNGAFVQLGGKITASDVVGQALFGTSVAISSDGSYILAGGPRDAYDAGSLWGFTLPQAAAITSVSDIPTDQGGKVRITWHKSEFDYPRDIGQVTHYGIWRKLPPAGTQLTPPPGSAAGTLNDTLGLYYDLIATVPALQSTTYNYVAPTLFDSSATGPHAAAFLITAHTANPNLYYLSGVATGYSVDNLSPAAVAGGAIASLPNGTIALAWNQNRLDSDLKGYRVYRSLAAGFTPGPSTAIGFTTDTTFADTSAQHGTESYYRIAAVDLHDNAGPPSAELHATPVGAGGPAKEVPEVFSLSQNYPNPFNPATTIRYGLPVRSRVLLTIFNTLGQKVAVLAEGEEEAGYHNIVFDARGLASGIYLCRITAGEFVQVRKLLLVK